MLILFQYAVPIFQSSDVVHTGCSLLYQAFCEISNFQMKPVIGFQVGMDTFLSILVVMKG